MASRFEVGATEFLLDGQPFQVVSGAMHYWRIVPEQWRDRIAWARHLGLNTIETYVPWNLHQPRPGASTFDGALDLRRYLRLIADTGLHAIVRPGPYICAECDFGGLPAWLLAEPGLIPRTADPAYLAHVGGWFDDLFPQLVDLQCTRGGPILAMQVENERGSAGPAPEYLDWLTERTRSYGVDVPLVTSDNHDGIEHGTRPGLLATMNFGRDPADAWAARDRARPGGPRMCMEFWLGWFDHWGEWHHRREPDDVAAVLDEILGAGASVNLYLFCGGTNFGFTNGANHEHDHYQATTTSYDYDAPLSEGGTPTPKFDRLREVIARHTGTAPAPAPPLPPLLEPRTVSLTRAAGLLDALPRLAPEPLVVAAPMTMEALGQNAGFVCYSFTADTAGPHELDVPGIRDRGQILVDGVQVGVLEREHKITNWGLRTRRDGARVDLLVENQGRVNYGPGLADRKGVVGDIRWDGEPVTELTIHPLPLHDLDVLEFGAVTDPRGPVFLSGQFHVDAPADTYLALPGWRKGVVWINGFNLGRYWDRGPQRTLYLPGPLLRAGTNELRVLELHAFTEPTVQLTPTPDLGTF